MQRMKGRNERTALITGASSGIGTALAEEFARNGHDLVLVARREGRLEQVGGRLSQQYGVDASIISKDLSLPEAAREVFNELHERSVHIDILVNNAGMIVYGEFSENDLDVELRMIGVNLLATTKLTKLFLPAMIRKGSGRILNLGSNGSFAPSPLNAVYSATKAYVLSFSEAIAEELTSTGVTVTTLCPGATESELQRRAGMDDVRLLQSGVMSAEKVAEIGYQSLMDGERVVVPGLMNKLQIFLLRFLPRRMVVKLAQGMLQRTS